jgi:SPP1 family predicted phage head-tail adaptor
MRTPALRHSIAIRRPAQVEKPTGGYSTVWNDIAQPWAEILGMDGREAVLDRVMQGVSTYQFTVRWRDDLKASDQVRYAGLDLNILAPPRDPDGRRRWTVFVASTEAARS